MIHGRTHGGLCPLCDPGTAGFGEAIEKTDYLTPYHQTDIYPLYVGVVVSKYDLCFRFVSSLPLTDFQFTMSLSHDVPLATSLGHCLYVLGSIQRTGEKLLLQYNTKQGEAEQHSPG